MAAEQDDGLRRGIADHMPDQRRQLRGQVLGRSHARLPLSVPGPAQQIAGARSCRAWRHDLVQDHAALRHPGDGQESNLLPMRRTGRAQAFGMVSHQDLVHSIHATRDPKHELPLSFLRQAVSVLLDVDGRS